MWRFTTQLRQDPCPGLQISLAQGVSDRREVSVGEVGRQGLNKWLGVEETPEGLCLVPVRASGGHCAGPDPVLQAEASLIAGN